MCRIFGFRSVMQSGVHRSLVSADNALMQQSCRHPDGWGVAYYVANAPHVIKSASAAVSDHLFRHLSGIVTSETVLAHIRKATQGELSTINTHPFQFGAWVFAHNGNIAGFDGVRDQLVARVPPVLRRFILGKTDSEVLFYLILGKMAQRHELHRPGFPLAEVASATREALAEVESLVGPCNTDNDGPPHETYLTFVLTNGHVMLGHQGGKQLYFSTHKQRCPERETCAFFSGECERAPPTERGFVSHLIFSSEPLHGDNVWIPLAPGDMVGADGRMQMQRFAAGVPVDRRTH
ncbi:class II glutamine amidotransferase [Nannocystis pusilla]|uniref:class II glutamine amidotransferase n=1 Tax=Nannocystis pusilla TaxID=889268 RepID=UPI003BF1A239